MFVRIEQHFWENSMDFHQKRTRNNSNAHFVSKKLAYFSLAARSVPECLAVHRDLSWFRLGPIHFENFQQSAKYLKTLADTHHHIVSELEFGVLLSDLFPPAFLTVVLIASRGWSHRKQIENLRTILTISLITSLDCLVWSGKDYCAGKQRTLPKVGNAGMHFFLVLAISDHPSRKSFADESSRNDAVTNTKTPRKC